MEAEGSFRLFRNFLGTIAGGLTSLVSIPFGKRKKYEDHEEFLGPKAGEETSEDLSKLYPDAELSETRKRARFFVEGCQGECSKEKDNEEVQTENISDLAPIGAYGNLDNLGVTNSGSASAAGNQGACDLTPDSVQVVNEEGLYGLPRIGELPVDEGSPDQGLDENLASFKRALMAKKAKQPKRGPDSINEESPRKRVRFGTFPSVLSSDSQMDHGHHNNEDVHSTNRKRKRGVDVEDRNQKKVRGLTMRKRKRDVEVEDKNEKKLRALTISDKPVRVKENRPLATTTGGLERKQNRMDHGPAVTRAVIDPMKLNRTTVVENLPLNAERKALSKLESSQLDSALPLDEKAVKKKQRNKIPNSQTADSVYKDERPSKAASEENTLVPHLSKRLRSSGPEGIGFQEKRVKLVSQSGDAIVTQAASYQGRRSCITRSQKLDVNQPRKSVAPSGRHLHSTRQAHGSEGQCPVSNESPEAKRKRVEKHQRGISRSKKIRRT